MGEPPIARMDVRDMHCAQALAQLGVVMKRLARGAVLELVCNTDDVTRDILVWARACHHAVLTTEARGGDTWLNIQK